MDAILSHLPLIAASFIIFLGLLGALLPVLPGCFIIWAGILLYHFWGPDDLGWAYLITNGLLALAAQLLDYLCTVWGARRFGGSWRGVIGALAGALMGPFLLTPLIGLIIGPILGAVIGELSSGRTWRESGRAGVGTVVGGLVSFALKLALACFMAGWFWFRVLW